MSAMLSAGICYALLTGACWCAIGIVLSCCARKKLDVIGYSLLQNGLAAAACFVCYAVPGKVVFNSGFYLLCAVILCAALLNAFAQYLVKRAMDDGHYAPVWAMAQAAMLFPFLCGVFFCGNNFSIINAAGLLLLFGGVVLPCHKGFTRPGSWLKSALAALFCYGVLQSLYLLPSHVRELTDPGSMRPVLVCLGNFTGWGILSLCRREKLHFNRSILYMALVMTLLHTVSVKTFFHTLDALGKAGAGGIGIPFMQGANLVFFGIYSLVFLREKRTAENVISELLILGGLLCLIP